MVRATFLRREESRSNVLVAPELACSSSELLERLLSILKDQGLRLKDLPESDSPDFAKLLQELGFSSALERVKLAKAVRALRSENEANLKDSDGDTKFDTWQYEEMSRVQKAEAKCMVKDFVKAMVHGRRLQKLSAETGEIVDVQVSLNKKVDRLTIEGIEAQRNEAPILTDLCDILHVEPMTEPDLTVLVKTRDSELCLLLPSLEERDAFTNALGSVSVFRSALIGDAVVGVEMQSLGSEAAEEEKGVFTAEVRILKETSNFQIYRDRDFEQGFYPAPEATGGGSDQEIQGPDELGQGLNWVVKGKAQSQVGDVFKITFLRQVRRSQDKRSISWERLRNETVDFQEMSKSHKYYLVGSWNQFRECKEMLEDQVNGQKRVLKQEFTVGKTGTEKFQILLNCNFLATVHPDVDEASQAGYKLCGPDDAGSGKYWATGTSEKLIQGDHVMVYLELSGGLPHNVWWERFNSPDAHQEYLAAGAQRVWERHNRLMGLIPWQSDE
ncbi:unnamed protein product, partial [Symbiodinium necroappetens]